MVIMVLIKLRSSQAWCQSNQIESQAWVVLLTQIYQDWRSEAGGLGWRKMEDWSEVWSFFSWWTIDHRHDIVDVDDHIFPDDDIIFCQYFHGDAILIARFMIPWFLKEFFCQQVRGWLPIAWWKRGTRKDDFQFVLIVIMIIVVIMNKQGKMII